jgi:hypothetical protein
VVRFRTIGKLDDPHSPGSYIWLRPLLQAAPAAAVGQTTGQAWDSNCTTFALKVLLASRAFFLWFLPLVLPLQLHWLLAVQPLLLLLVARQNRALCSVPAMRHPGALRWMRAASWLLSLATAVGMPAVQVAQGQECQAFVLFLQLSLGLIMPLWVVARRECSRFDAYAAQRGLSAGSSRGWVRGLLAAQLWLNGSEWETVRWATLAVLLCATWIGITVAFC